jgi:hypothetical protein
MRRPRSEDIPVVTRSQTAAACVALVIVMAPSMGQARPRPPAPLSPQARLEGVWELKADDGRTGRMTLRVDGTITASSASGDSKLPDYNGRWFLLAADGDLYSLEFAKEQGEPGAYRVKLVMTCWDAFTLVETVKGGVPIRDQQRFVRLVPSEPGG